LGGGLESIPPPQEVQNATRTGTADAPSHSRLREAQANLWTNTKASNQTTQTGNTLRICSGAERGMANGSEMVRAIVVKVTVAFAAFVPSSVTEAGDTVHVAAGGAPVQLQVTV